MRHTCFSGWVNAEIKERTEVRVKRGFPKLPPTGRKTKKSPSPRIGKPDLAALTTGRLKRAQTAMLLADRELRAVDFQDYATEHEVEQTKLSSRSTKTTLAVHRQTDGISLRRTGRSA